MKNDLLRQAIADAEQIKKLAVENAKKSLQETFEPFLKNLVNDKLSEEADEEDDKEEADEQVDVTDEVTDLDEKKKKEETPAENEAPAEDDEESIDEIDIDAILAEIEDEEGEEAPAEEKPSMDEKKKADACDDEEMTSDDEDLDEEINLNQLLGELSEGEDETTDDEEENSDEPIDEGTGAENAIQSIAQSLPHIPGLSPDLVFVLFTITTVLGISSAIVYADKIKQGAGAAWKKAMALIQSKKSDIKKDVDGGDDKTNVKETSSETASLRQELQEVRKHTKQLVGKMNEVNLINAKLLYFNKFLAEGDLTKDQKIKAMKAFDRAKTTSEAKLVYESLIQTKPKTTKVKPSLKESLGIASKAAGKSTKQKEQIVESTTYNKRWMELANLKD